MTQHNSTDDLYRQALQATSSDVKRHLLQQVLAQDPFHKEAASALADLNRAGSGGLPNTSAVNPPILETLTRVAQPVIAWVIATPINIAVSVAVLVGIVVIGGSIINPSRGELDEARRQAELLLAGQCGSQPCVITGIQFSASDNTYDT